MTLGTCAEYCPGNETFPPDRDKWIRRLKTRLDQEKKNADTYGDGVALIASLYQ